MSGRKTSFDKQKYYIAYLVFYIIIALIFLGMSFFTRSVAYLDTSNSVTIESALFDEDFSTRILSPDEIGPMTYRAVVPLSSFDQLDGDEFKVILSSINDNAIQIWINGYMVLSEGNLMDGQSMLKADFVYGSFPKDILEANNEIIVDTYSTYKTGSHNGIRITEYEPGLRTIRLYEAFKEMMVMIGVGLMILSSVFTLIVYSFYSKDNKALLWLALGVFTMSFYFLDFINLNYLSFDYMIYKKVFLMALAIGFFFVGMAVKETIGRSFVAMPAILQLIYAFIFISINQSLPEMKQMYNVWYGMIGIAFTFMLIAVLISVRRNGRALIFLIHFLASVVVIVETFYSGDNLAQLDLTSPMPVMFVQAVLPMMFTFDIFLDKQLGYEREVALRKLATNQSMTDDLTGIWNKRYLTEVFTETEGNCVAMIDMDNLKSINDTYGHLAGDFILKEIGLMLKDSIRKSDIVCRYGGDEFFVLFNQCSQGMAHQILEKVRGKVASRDFDFNGLTLESSLSIGIYGGEALVPEDMIHLADKALYRAKLEGKNRIVVV